MQYFSRVIYIVISFALLGSPLVYHLFGYSFYKSNSENRIAKKLPEYKSFNSNSEYIIEFDEYLKDNHAFRDLGISSYNTMMYLLNVSKTKNIVIGKQGWIYNNYDDVFDQLEGKKRIKSYSLAKSIKSLKINSDYFKNKNIPFIFYIAPNKHSIYPEYLPYYDKNSGKNNMDIFQESLNKHKIPFVNTKRNIIKNKNNHQPLLYFKTDTHWKIIGAYYAYTELIRALNKKIPQLKPSSLERFKTKKYSKNFGLLSRMGTFPFIVDNGVDIQLRNSKIIREDYSKKNRNVTGRKTSIYGNLDSDTELTLLLIGDSFNGYIVQPFLTNFKKVIVTFHNEGRWDTSILNDHNIDAVIFEKLERTITEPLHSPNLQY